MKNLVRLTANTPAKQISAMLEVCEWASAHNFDPIWDVQILTAVNAKSDLARKPLNKILQEKLNQREGVKGSPFRVGDKIVNTQNGYFKPAKIEGGEPQPAKQVDIYAANGDVARVVEIHPKHLVAQLLVGGHLIMIPRGKASEPDKSDDADGDPDPDAKEKPSTGCSWDLAYALSTHKSQGSEFPICCVMLDKYPGAMRIASREWIYTANSRGKKLQIEIGQRSTVQRMVRNVALGNRKTLLRERINQLQCERMVEGL